MLFIDGELLFKVIKSVYRLLFEWSYAAHTGYLIPSAEGYA